MPANSVELIKERLDIVDIIGDKVNLKKTGRSFKGLCPFHQEKTPSFVVFPESQHFHCFGCGKSGDLFTFYELSQKVEFREALTELAQRAGVELESTRPETAPPDPTVARSRDLNELAAQLFSHVLLNTASGEPGRAYLAQRGLDAATIERFRLGFAPNSWDYLLKQSAARGIDPRAMFDAGLLQERDNGGYYDRFRNRLIFPIRDRDGAVVGFGARAMGDDQPKYLNSAQSSLFDKSRILYGLDLAKDAIRDEDRVVIVEGYMDVIAAHQFEHRNVVATMGTAVTESQIELVKRMTKRIVLALDADAAGQMAALRTIESIHTGLDQTEEFVPDPRTAFRIARRIDTEITVAEMPVGKDPDELIRTSPELWNGVIDSARPYAEFLISKVTESVDLADPSAKRHAIDRLAPVLQLVPDELTRSHYAQLVGRRLDLPFREVKARLQRSAPSGFSRRGAHPVQQEQTGALHIEDHLLALLLKHRALVFDLTSEVPPDDVMDSRNRTLLSIVRDASLPDEHFAAGFTDSLDPVLAEHAIALVRSIDSRPSQLPGEVREEVLQTLMRLERERYDLLSAHLRSEIATAEAARDQELLPTLLAQYDRLSIMHKRTYPPLSPYFRDSRTRTPLKKPSPFSRQ
ncbi:MAG TPA: DNA primase [Thermomicrobiales bacterium]|nr:DNA primase [Thermomicrobiales bacterium]